MAIVEGRTPLSTADSSAAMDTFSATAGAVDTDTRIEGSGSIADTNDSTSTWQGIMFDNGSTRDWTGEHLFFWFNHAAAGIVQEFVVRFANAAGDWMQARIASSEAGINPRLYTGGWVQLVFSANKLFAQQDLSDGTPPTLASARYVGIGARLIDGVMPKKQDNIFIDACWRLPADTPAFRIEGTNGGVPWNWQDILDWSLANENGLVQEVNGVLMINGPFQIGDSAGTSSTEFSDATGKVIQFTDDWLVEDDFFEITMAGNGTGTTDIDLGTVVGSGDDRQGASGGVIRSSRKAFTIDAETDIADLDTVNLYGVTLQGAGITRFSGSTKTDLIGLTAIDCAEVQPNDAECLNGTIVAPRGRGLEMLSSHNIKQMNFIAGDKTQVPETFGTSTVSSSDSVSDPHSFSHTVATGSTSVALLVLLAIKDDSTPPPTIWEVTYNSVQMMKIGGTHSNAAGVQISAWLLYNPTEGSSQTINIDLEGSIDRTIAVKALNIRGTPPLGKIKVVTNEGSAVTSITTSIVADSTDAFSIDLVQLGGNVAADASGGDATETDDAQIGTDSERYLISEVAGGLAGSRDHSWSWTGANEVNHLVVLFEDEVEEHHVHHNNIGDASITYEGMQFFGFGAAGSPKWHGENSEANADITINTSEGANPAANEFENTGSPVGTITVVATAPLKVTVTNHVGNVQQGINVRYEESDGTLISQGSTDASGIFEFDEDLANLPHNNAKIIARQKAFEDFESILNMGTGGFDIPLTLQPDTDVNLP